MSTHKYSLIGVTSTRTDIILRLVTGREKLQHAKSRCYRQSLQLQEDSFESFNVTTIHQVKISRMVAIFLPNLPNYTLVEVKPFFSDELKDVAENYTSSRLTTEFRTAALLQLLTIIKWEGERVELTKIACPSIDFQKTSVQLMFQPLTSVTRARGWTQWLVSRYSTTQILPQQLLVLQ
jgi:hypothetical protein